MSDPGVDEIAEPVYRCDACSKLVLIAALHSRGMCPECGNKRMRNVQAFNDDERAQMTEWGLDDFLKEFEAQDA
jgi:rRNA maturation endonuclease Nob1